MFFIWEGISFRSWALHMLSIIQIMRGFALSISTTAAGVSSPGGRSKWLVKAGGNEMNSVR